MMHLRREIPERLGHDGQVLEALNPESTRAAVRDLVDSAGIEALAICFLHSYANPVHEDAAGELVRAEFPHLHVSRSAEVFGNMREYERWTTATMNAYTQPMFDRYIERLERGLADLGFGGRLFVMTSSGASIVPETARRFPVRAFRIHASERGFDYRRSSMVAFGGSSPVHALAIARKLRIPRVIFPIGAGVMSALGLLVSPCDMWDRLVGTTDEIISAFDRRCTRRVDSP